MTEPSEHIDAPRATILGAVHTSTATVMSYSLITAAAMLTFFFAFQGILLSNFPALHKGLADLPASRWLLTALCVLAVVFSIWSALIVGMFIDYFEGFVASAVALERASGLGPESLYSTIDRIFGHSRAQSCLRLTTWIFFAVLSIVWFILIFAVWGPQPVLGD
jgi:hypothetical protein